MYIDALKNAILQNIGHLKPSSNGWLKRCCMLCHTQGHGKDTRNRFGIQFNPESIAVNCFNCGFSAAHFFGKPLSKSFKFFLKNINIDDDFIKHLEFEIFKISNKISIFREGDEENSLKSQFAYVSIFDKWAPVKLPKDSMPLSFWIDNNLTDPDFLKVLDYSKKRKILEFDNFYWSPIKEHNIYHRLIIPYYYQKQIVGFTSRLCYDLSDKRIPKYYQKCPHDFVYNLDNQQPWARKTVIVTEGVLDAWTVDGVAVLGEVSQTKIDIINRLQKRVIVCPDRDKKGSDLVDIALNNGWAVCNPKWETGIKDAAQAAEKYGRLLTLHSILTSAIDDKMKIKLEWKLKKYGQ